MAERLNYWYEHLDELRSDTLKEKVLEEAATYRIDKAVDDYEEFINRVVDPPSVKRMPSVSVKELSSYKKAVRS
ncbi:MAG: hypothetical protein H8E51_12035 [Bacteroidetes bacterium]|nr:hypothetical protein [Bacteroidota bacterium]